VRAVEEWERSGTRMTLAGWDVFVLDRRPERERAEPVLLLHGFPTCSFDWRFTVPALARDRRVVALDFLGFGLSEKPDRPYSLFEQADIASECVRALGLTGLALVTHDMGDSVGGELLARSLEGSLPFRVTKRVLTDGSIYVEMAQLSAGQKLLLTLPDEIIPTDGAPTGEMFKAGLAGTFGPATQPSAGELDAQWDLMSRGEGHRLLARIMRYYNERLEHQGRWTGAIRDHPAPVTVIWGDRDPIAVYAMAERFVAERSGTPLVRLEGIGHYLMIEAPERFNEALVAALA
jgi:pimeloyl-ACP methyl ester carboxylesterase